MGGRARSYSALCAGQASNKSRPVTAGAGLSWLAAVMRIGIARTTNMHQDWPQRYGFIAVYPNGTGASKESRRLSWNAGSTPPSRVMPKTSNVDDIGFRQSHPATASAVLSHRLEKEFTRPDFPKAAMFAVPVGVRPVRPDSRPSHPVAGSLTYKQCQPAQRGSYSAHSWQ
ncbi:MAG: hypothetical protein V9H25_14645 [Candidatus Competibacter sp.]